MVTCCQSTFAFEMMAHNLPIWYLETGFRFLDIVEDGIAHSVTLETVDNMRDADVLEPFLTPRYSREHFLDVFSDRELSEVLRQMEGYREPSAV